MPRLWNRKFGSSVTFDKERLFFSPHLFAFHHVEKKLEVSVWQVQKRTLGAASEQRGSKKDV